MWLEPIDNRGNEPLLDRGNKPPFEIGAHRAWIGDVVGPLHQDIVHGLESIAVWRTELAQRRDGPLCLTLWPAITDFQRDRARSISRRNDDLRVDIQLIR